MVNIFHMSSQIPTHHFQIVEDFLLYENQPRIIKRDREIFGLGETLKVSTLMLKTMGRTTLQLGCQNGRFQLPEAGQDIFEVLIPDHFSCLSEILKEVA